MILRKINTLIDPLRSLANALGSPLWDLAARLFLAKVFFTSGMLRYNDWVNGSFDTQIMLFTDEHPVPGLSPEFAATMTTGAELLLPVLLVLGIFTRVGAGGVLVMTAVIEMTYGHFSDHILWAFLATAIFIKGPGALSIDQFFVKWLRRG